MSERAGDHKGDGIVSCFGLSQESPSCDSPRPGLDKSYPDYLPIYTLSCCRHSASPRNLRIYLSLGYQSSIIRRPAIVGLPHTQRRGVPSRTSNWCVCVCLGITNKERPNPRPLHQAAAAAPDNVSSRPFCCLQQRAPPAWFCPFSMFPPEHIYAAHLQPISTRRRQTSAQEIVIQYLHTLPSNTC